MKKSCPRSTLSSFPMTKKLPHLTESTAGHLSSELRQIFISLQAFHNRLLHSWRTVQLRQLEPDSGICFADHLKGRLTSRYF